MFQLLGCQVAVKKNRKYASHVLEACLYNKFQEKNV